MRIGRAAFPVLCLTLFGACGGGQTDGFVIANALLADGTGAPLRSGSVRVAGDSIVAIGDVSPRRGELVVDAAGMVLAPGFIDTHSHADGDLRDDTTALAAVSQGITTIVGGQDGGSFENLAGWFAAIDSNPAPLNVASYVGHGTIRERVMGSNYKREATQAEVDSMKAILRHELQSGALGLSSGLEYDPGIYSSTTEVLELARVTAELGGRYISHIRSEDFAFWRAIDEIIRIGKEAKLPVQISHVKLAMRDLWGRADSLVRVLDAARESGVDVTADIYPYLYWQSTLTVLFPKRDFENRKAANFALTQTTTPGGLRLARYRPNRTYEGKTLRQIAELRGVDSVTALIDLIRDAQKMRADTSITEGVESIIATSMTEPDVRRLMQWPHTNFCTDGALLGSHPRGFGSYPRIFGFYVRDSATMSVEEAVKRASALAAEHMGFTDRGTLAVGKKADMVLFDPRAVADRATPSDPHAVSTGVLRTWVNGREVYRDGRATGAKAGRVLRRKGR